MLLFFLEDRSTMFHLKLTNLPPYIDSTKSSSEPKYDMNTTQKTSTGRSKKLYELSEKMSKYTSRSIQLLRVEMNSLFLSIYKVNKKSLTNMLCMTLGHIPFLFTMLGPNSPFVVIFT